MNTETINYMGQKRPHVCALISLGNALLHFGAIDQPWDQDSEDFALLVRQAGAEHGSAIEERLDEIEERFTVHPQWPRIRVDKYRALEMSKELATKLLDKGGVISIPIWDDKIGLHSVLIIGHQDGQFFRLVNREPFTNGVVSTWKWEDLGYRRWNVPVRVYWRAE